ncbi:hypothetical protein AB4Z10_10370 [Bosea sp. RAF48]|uniref:hypothetical protein n=1 Tax=Bosea sp. RAF48 TaxID=3237480 RepID=UPI003F8DCD1E
MNNVLAFRRPALPFEYGTTRPDCCRVLHFAPRMAAKRPRLVVEWRLNDVDGRLECRWQSAGGEDAARRSCFAHSRTFRRRASGNAAFSIGHAGHCSAGAP